MTRGNPSDLQPFDPEIDRTFHRLVRHHLVPFEHHEHSVIGDFEHYSFEHSENMAQPPPRERTLREMAAPDFTYESLCIQYPDEDIPYVLKTGLIHLLPKFLASIEAPQASFHQVVIIAQELQVGAP